MRSVDEAPSARLPSLDGLRALAVLLVMAGHFTHRTEIGSLGVGIFFVLSGFLITWLLERERRANGSISLRRFYIRRSLRIFPAFYTFLLAAALLYPLLGVVLPSADWLASAVYLNDYNSALTLRPSNALTHTWSLGIEEKFYLLWPLLLLICARRSVATASFACLATLVGVSGWRVYLAGAIAAPSHYTYFAFDTRLDYLAIGCLLGLHASMWLREPERRAVVICSGLAAVGGLAALTVTLSASRLYWLSFPLEYVLIALVLVAAVSAPRSPPFRILNSLPLIWLGIISYSAYLYHKLGWLLASFWLEPSLLTALLGGAIAIALAAASYLVIERPFLRLKARYSPAMHPGNAQPAHPEPHKQHKQ